MLYRNPHYALLLLASEKDAAKQACGKYDTSIDWWPESSSYTNPKENQELLEEMRIWKKNFAHFDYGFNPVGYLFPNEIFLVIEQKKHYDKDVWKILGENLVGWTVIWEHWMLEIVGPNSN